MHFYIPIRATLFDKLKEMVNNLQELSDQNEILLYGSHNLKGNQNLQILNCTIKYIMDSKRFTSSLFYCRTITGFVCFFYYEFDLDLFILFINSLIFPLKSINNTEKMYSHKKHFSCF